MLPHQLVGVLVPGQRLCLAAALPAALLLAAAAAGSGSTRPSPFRPPCLCGSCLPGGSQANAASEGAAASRAAGSAAWRSASDHCHRATAGPPGALSRLPAGSWKGKGLCRASASEEIDGKSWCRAFALNHGFCTELCALFVRTPQKVLPCVLAPLSACAWLPASDCARARITCMCAAACCRAR